MISSKSTTGYNYFKEKRILQEEEKCLKSMLTKFQDQLNRLKIEELALITLMKMKEEKQEADTSETKTKKEGGPHSLDSISDISASSVIPVGLMFENSANINKQSLDLKVNQQKIEDDHRMEDFEEEEDDDSSEGDVEIIEDVSDDGDEYSKQLRSYMDSI